MSTSPTLTYPGVGPGFLGTLRSLQSSCSLDEWKALHAPENTLVVTVTFQGRNTCRMPLYAYDYGVEENTKSKGGLRFTRKVVVASQDIHRFGEYMELYYPHIVYTVTRPKDTVPGR